YSLEQVSALCVRRRSVFIEFLMEPGIVNLETCSVPFDHFSFRQKCAHRAESFNTTVLKSRCVFSLVRLGQTFERGYGLPNALVIVLYWSCKNYLGQKDQERACENDLHSTTLDENARHKFGLVT